MKLFRQGTALFYDIAIDRVALNGKELPIGDIDAAPLHEIAKMRIQPNEIGVAGLDARWTQNAVDEKKVKL